MKDEIRYSSNLEEWRRWQVSQGLTIRRAVRWTKDLFKGGRGTADFQLFNASERARILVALDSLGPTPTAALIEPLKHVANLEWVAVLAPQGTTSVGPFDKSESCSAAELADKVPNVDRVVSLGNYLPAGAAACDLAQERGVRFIAVQHGLLTPFAPPLPPNCELLAFSEADAEYWRADRDDVTARSVGSQLLWNAKPDHAPDNEGPGYFLGQLHGAELPRKDFAISARQYCETTRATYRPHPAETDALSRMSHRRWAKHRIEIDHEPTPLAELRGPVAAVFSTGVLEAASAGKPSWVHHPYPPPWLSGMWERYGMSRWRAYRDPEPTKGLRRPEVEPAVSVAKYVTEGLETR